jgi:hypothetical protein
MPSRSLILAIVLAVLAVAPYGCTPAPKAVACPEAIEIVVFASLASLDNPKPPTPNPIPATVPAVPAAPSAPAHAPAQCPTGNCRSVVVPR